MLRHPLLTRIRIQKAVDRLRGLIYADHRDIDSIRVAGPTDRIPYARAQELTGFRDVAIGEQFGPGWSTFWFRLEATVPEGWTGRRVDLLWDSQSEATLWVDGRSVQGLNKNRADRPDAVLLRQAEGGETLQMQIEMACNQMTGLVHTGAADLGPLSPFQLKRCAIAAFDPEAWKMYHDVVVLVQLEGELEKEGATADRNWQGHLLNRLNAFVNTIDLVDRATWPAAAEILTELYEHRNASRTFRINAIGHGHIDTAWLWPLAEGYRKCERTFSTATTYMTDYPEYRFACSQAYQYQQIKDRNPDLYARIKAAVERGQWVPVGGSWIEPDCNIPSGESLCRQFLTGQRFFEREFGFRCREFWNPDVFGYNGQLPQIMRHAGIGRFLTVKLSWNYHNKPDQSTFLWRGIDGSEVFTHFPPANTYGDLAELVGDGSEIKALRDNAAKFKDHDRASEAASLFGHGDGGGGPTKRMLEILRRVKDLQSIPPVTLRSSDEIFDRLEADCVDPLVRVGEMYFERHRGTYTSQALIKRHNRFAECLLHDLEFLAARRSVVEGVPYPADALDRMWKIVLLNQFHDILPGSSIGDVYRDSEAQFESLFEEGKDLLRNALGEGRTAINTTGVSRTDVVEDDSRLQLVCTEPYASAQPTSPTVEVMLSEASDHYVLENAHLRARFDTTGRLLEMLCKETGVDVLAGPANVLEIYDDQPNRWEAWDVDIMHGETRSEIPAACDHGIVRQDPLRAEIRFEYAVGQSSQLSQTVRLDADAKLLRFDCHADWRESKKLLKVAFPVEASAMNATYEMQFGHVERPTHYNTSFDLARFEVPMHRWFDLSEPGRGLAVLNDCKYGGSTFENTMRLTLLRSPKHPDPDCDMGEHDFAFALVPHAGDWRRARVLEHAIAFNHPLRFGQAIDAQPFIRVDQANLIVDTIKRAEDGDGLIIRMYEAHGRRGVASLQFATAPTQVTRTNTMEDPGEAVDTNGDAVTVAYRPFELISLRIR